MNEPHSNPLHEGSRHSFLDSSWQRAWRGLHAATDGAPLRDTLVARYTEPHRKYHTLQHLAECLIGFERLHDVAERPHEVEMALWFHDAIYDLPNAASDNEARSAAWARSELAQAGVEAGATARVEQLVLITRHTVLPQTCDEQLLVDIDLSILGADGERFTEYERQIREEYAWVPDSASDSKRRAILESFLERQTIYSTPALHRELEARARANLAAAIAGYAT